MNQFEEISTWLWLNCDMSPHSQYKYRYKGRLLDKEELFDIYKNSRT